MYDARGVETTLSPVKTEHSTGHLVLDDGTRLRTNAKDISGNRYGKLTAIKPVSRHPIKWECKCDCGGVRITTSKSLTYGTAKSCGCLSSEHGKKLARLSITHGLSNSSIYRRWCGIIQRCTNPNNSSYYRYGGRGITVSDEWLSFERFVSDMGQPPFPTATIERKHNDLGYSKSNCVWATPKQQSRNTRNNHLLVFRGVSKPLVVWTEELNLNYDTVKQRLNKLGWTAEKALTTPTSHVTK